ncbi:class I SAM-dependent methyltransferase [Shimia sp. R9_1]|uniref:O-methyltransferase n=1 Tax=unclassified Shimia TaxID=2630038 RepID=UPI001AD986A4|nr:MULTISPECIES: class I SAM-dependent methyltransferase [unclassified Shimia]MBO9395891.1 class I SAM-dependent methyltransferase [Shimia sp. R9_2]MBO9407905.1 class I SAM-dependent methyltransferase [Shimia sp. R9_1]
MSSKKSLAARAIGRVRGAFGVITGTHVASPSEVELDSAKETLAEINVGEILARVPAGFRGAEFTPVDYVWWNFLCRSRTIDMFPTELAASKAAVKRINDFYSSNVERFGITRGNFFGGSIKDDEAVTLHRLIIEQKPKNVVQIGTFIGYSAAIIADALRQNGSGRLICIDPEIQHRSSGNPVDVAKELFANMGLSDIVSFETGWSSGRISHGYDAKVTSVDLEKARMMNIPVVGRDVLQAVEEGVDFAFVDGDHSTAFTLMDFHMIREYLNKGGIVLFHDAFSWPSVAQALSIIWSDILFFTKSTSEFFDLDVRKGRDGLAIIRKK